MKIISNKPPPASENVMNCWISSSFIFFFFVCFFYIYSWPHLIGQLKSDRKQDDRERGRMTGSRGPQVRSETWAAVERTLPLYVGLRLYQLSCWGLPISSGFGQQHIYKPPWALGEKKNHLSLCFLCNAKTIKKTIYRSGHNENNSKLQHCLKAMFELKGNVSQGPTELNHCAGWEQVTHSEYPYI